MSDRENGPETAVGRSSPESSPPRRRPSLLAGPLPKAILIGLLLLVLLVPLTLVEGIIAERESRYRSVVAEIGALWGGRQKVQGPLIAVPFERVFEVEKDEDDEDGTTKTRTVVQVAYFLPDDYRISGALDPEVRHRGVFEAAVYRADLRLEGTFVLPAVETWSDGSGAILWDEARLVLGISDPRSIGGGLTLVWNGRELDLEPGAPRRITSGLRGDLLSSSLSVLIPGLSGAGGGSPGQQPSAFSLSLQFNGSHGIDFLPLGRATEVGVTSSWPSPSFEGAHLPTRHEVGADGFSAHWSLSYYGRSYPQQWLDSDRVNDLAQAWQRSAFGVRLFQPVGAYHLAERTAKYGVLFLVYTLGALFLFEMAGGLRLHIVHYGLVGLSLCLFFLLLLSLAEHLGFATAYLIAAAAVVAQIGLYTWGAVGSRWRSTLFATLLAGVYGALYGLMQLETYALLIGSVCLFALLAVVMVVARRIDWYALNGRKSGASA